jgi:lauroyl/myristoyl acyltransferase
MRKGRGVASAKRLAAPSASTRLATGRAEAWLAGIDLRVLAKLPLAATLAWCVPERHWGMVTESAARLEPRARARLARQIATLFGEVALPEPVDRIALRHLAMLRLDQLLYLRSHAPRGWRADLALHGLDHLRGALSAGRGAILWVAPTVFAPLVAKRALHEAGFPPHHLSHPAHGFSSLSRVGRNLVNPLRTRIEDRYLAERVMLGRGNEAQAALRRIGALVRRNAVVSITVGGRGSRVTATPLLGGGLQVASGAPHLAMRLGAALLPTTVWRTVEGGFVTRIWPPLATGEGASLETVAAGLGAIVEAFTLAHPEQLHWGHNCIDLASPRDPA